MPWHSCTFTAVISCIRGSGLSRRVTSTKFSCIHVDPNFAACSMVPIGNSFNRAGTRLRDNLYENKLVNSPGLKLEAVHYTS